MKKVMFAIMKFTLFFALILFVSSSVVFAQSTQGDVADPTSFDFWTFTGTFAGFAAGSVVLTELVKKLLVAIFKTIPSWLSLAISWILPIAASLLFNALNVGIFEGLTPPNTIVIGFGAALCSNGIFDCASITGLLNLIYGKKTDN